MFTKSNTVTNSLLCFRLRKRQGLSARFLPFAIGYGGSYQDRTGDLLLARQALSQTELKTHMVRRVMS